MQNFSDEEKFVARRLDEGTAMKSGRRYPSSTDVARAAGVSQSAVSRAFSEGKSVSEETSRKVFKAAKKLGYSPNFIPRILLKHRSHLVAVVISGTSNPFYALALEEFTKALQKTGHQVLLVQVDSDHALDGIVPKLASYRVDAIVSALPVLSKECGACFRTGQDPDDLVQHAGQEPLGDVGLLRQRRRR